MFISSVFLVITIPYKFTRLKLLILFYLRDGVVITVGVVATVLEWLVGDAVIAGVDCDWVVGLTELDGV